MIEIRRARCSCISSPMTAICVTRSSAAMGSSNTKKSGRGANARVMDRLSTHRSSEKDESGDRSFIRWLDTPIADAKIAHAGP